jgi:hypothetical protein
MLIYLPAHSLHVCPSCEKAHGSRSALRIRTLRQEESRGSVLHEPRTYMYAWTGEHAVQGGAGGREKRANIDTGPTHRVPLKLGISPI